MKENRDFAQRVYLADSISTYAELAQHEGEGALKFPWPADMVAYYSDKLLHGGFICHSAWQAVSTKALVGLVDTVRNLTLKMALEIKDELGTSYDDLHNVKPDEARKIESIVINAVGSNVAVGNIDASGQTIIATGDRASLDQALTKVGLDKSDLNELSEAILVDGGSKAGSNVMEWIQSKAGKVVAGGVKVGTEVGKQLLTEFLIKKFGLKG